MLVFLKAQGKYEYELFTTQNRFSLSMEVSRLTRDGTTKPVSRSKFSGANADREILIFPVELATGRVATLPDRSILLLLFVEQYIQ